MKEETPKSLTMQDAVTRVEANGTKSQKQDIRKAKAAFAIHGLEGPDFDSFPADLMAYEKAVPRLRGSMPALQALIEAAGISEGSYKQHQRAGRRLIETLTGANTAKLERRARDDEWAALLHQVSILVKAGFARPFHRVSLTALADTCRAAEIPPQALTPDHIQGWLSNAHTAKRKSLRNGLKTLDDLRDVDRLRPLLPPHPVTPTAKPASRIGTLPLPLQNAVNTWVDVAAREQIESEEHRHLAESLAGSTRGVYSAATTLYIQGLLNFDCSFAEDTQLNRLFTKVNIDVVLSSWSQNTSQSERTQAEYAQSIGSLLTRNGLPDLGSYVLGLTKTLPHLKKGRSAGKVMSPKVKRWCENLLRDPKKSTLFQIQHLEYYCRALEALAGAKTAGFDLVSLSKPEVLDGLPAKDRAQVKAALRLVRMFGVMAAYSAIALEGAPFRRMNMLSMRHTGPNKTLFLHLKTRAPHIIIKFPNEELKNGVYLSDRGEELEPITIEKRAAGDHAIEILTFYLREIRPLFPEADKTHAFFPPIESAASATTGFVKGTFYDWLAEASAAIGLPLNSHNYRHGFCSIDINEGRRSIEDLAKILGDSVAVVQRNYAWINAKKSVLNVQKDAAKRRSEILKARGTAR
ncbi:site-specific integrase [Rhodobacteraceae bacterium R_SAG2]|nr:site-specific integrase [Rhodobacteraceae bacterium R_SAG2]